MRLATTGRPEFFLGLGNRGEKKWRKAKRMVMGMMMRMGVSKSATQCFFFEGPSVQDYWMAINTRLLSRPLFDREHVYDRCH